MASVQVVTNSATPSIAYEGSSSLSAQCPAGTVRVGGGGRVAGTEDVAMTASAPVGAAGWEVVAQRDGLVIGSRTITINVHVLCAAGP